LILPSIRDFHICFLKAIGAHVDVHSPHANN
jgi:hypothetical protein